MADAGTVTRYRRPLSPLLMLTTLVLGRCGTWLVKIIFRPIVYCTRPYWSWHALSRSIRTSSSPDARAGRTVTSQWVLACVGTNAPITRVTAHLIALLRTEGHGGVGEPPTDNCDPVGLTSRWSCRSVAVIAGLGTLGLPQTVITDAGCARRSGTAVTDADRSPSTAAPKDRWLHFRDGSCTVWIARCTMDALCKINGLHGETCRSGCLDVARTIAHLRPAAGRGKCAIDPGSSASHVP